MEKFNIVGNRFKGAFNYEPTSCESNGTNSEAADFSYFVEEHGSIGKGQITDLLTRKSTPEFEFDTPKTINPRLDLFEHLCMVLPNMRQLSQSNLKDGDKLLE